MSKGVLISCVGGLYSVIDDTGSIIKARARGAFRHARLTPLPGDIVTLHKENDSFAIDAVAERKNFLIRPPVANLDTLFISFAPTSPEPNLLCVDKLITVVEAAGITPVIVITKSDLDAPLAERYRDIYEKAKLRVFVTSSAEKSGADAIRDYMRERGEGGIFAFAGASGIGKSSLMNVIFPELSLKTGSLSEKIARGKQTTRTTELFPVNVDGTSLFVADTPGFSSLDFASLMSFKKEMLAPTFHEFEDFFGECRYRDCTHTKEEECGVTRAVRRGDIAKSRHGSFLSMYEEIANLGYRKQ